ncbi:hypothetical protein FRB96_006848 [Tulasnella sp. 330]|nr:hypothetical protein FRB96_006848 [Tulasnella sp. 330]
MRFIAIISTFGLIVLSADSVLCTPIPVRLSTAAPNYRIALTKRGPFWETFKAALGIGKSAINDEASIITSKPVRDPLQSEEARAASGGTTTILSDQAALDAWYLQLPTKRTLSQLSSVSTEYLQATADKARGDLNKLPDSLRQARGSAIQILLHFGLAPMGLAHTTTADYSQADRLLTAFLSVKEGDREALRAVVTYHDKLRLQNVRDLKPSLKIGVNGGETVKAAPGIKENAMNEKTLTNAKSHPPALRLNRVPSNVAQATLLTDQTALKAWYDQPQTERGLSGLSTVSTSYLQVIVDQARGDPNKLPTPLRQARLSALYLLKYFGSAPVTNIPVTAADYVQGERLLATLSKHDVYARRALDELHNKLVAIGKARDLLEASIRSGRAGVETDKAGTARAVRILEDLKRSGDQGAKDLLARYDRAQMEVLVPIHRRPRSALRWGGLVGG